METPGFKITKTENDTILEFDNGGTLKESNGELDLIIFAVFHTLEKN